MAYLLDKVPAFDKDGKVGIIHQIHNSLDQVKKAVEDRELTKAEGVYWFREVATTWLYLVGDDSGAVKKNPTTTDSAISSLPKARTAPSLKTSRPMLARSSHKAQARTASAR